LRSGNWQVMAGRVTRPTYQTNRLFRLK